MTKPRATGARATPAGPVETDVRRAMMDARRRLTLAGVPDPIRDASALFLAVAETQVGSADTMPEDVARAYAHAVERRVRRNPVSHITGRRAFWMHDFYVTPEVLDPRPETETLVEHAVRLLAPRAANPAHRPRVLDLGTGSGCILLSILHEIPTATGLGVDVSAAALDVARRNAHLVGVTNRAHFRAASWYDGLEGAFDLIVSNPPYIPAKEIDGLAPEVRDHEPHLALTDGGDGLSAYSAIAAGAHAHLHSGAHLLVEIGIGQADAVKTIFTKAGLLNPHELPDLSGRTRAILAQTRA
ncbi:MAG: peptide chain release factor N(5)-glutamine methyltransferase [Pseudomonadota bacterium]